MKTAPRTVLIVDDDAEILEAMTHALAGEYRVLSATNGDDGVRLAQRELPDAILLDVMMPGGKDGFSTFADLQKDPRTRNIPVLMQTDVNRKTGLAFDAALMGQHLGKAPAAFLQKPVSAKKALDEIHKVLKSRGALT